MNIKILVESPFKQNVKKRYVIEIVRPFYVANFDTNNHNLLRSNVLKDLDANCEIWRLRSLEHIFHFADANIFSSDNLHLEAFDLEGLEIKICLNH